MNIFLHFGSKYVKQYLNDLQTSGANELFIQPGHELGCYIQEEIDDLSSVRNFQHFQTRSIVVEKPCSLQRMSLLQGFLTDL